LIVTIFGQEIKRLRVEAGFSVRELAHMVSKSTAYIGKIESQGEIPSADFVCKLAMVLGRDPELLLRLAKESQLSIVERDINRKHTDALEHHLKMSRDKTHQQKVEDIHMATVVSLINMKGGVGKTTLATQLAHSADKDRYRILVVDLDPQSNLSQSLMGPRKYVEHLSKGLPTVAQIFDDYVGTSRDSSAPRPIDLNEVIVKNAGYWSNSNLDLIPSRLELSRTLKNPTGKERRLAKALARVHDRYDLIIIDCAPTESIITDAAYFASRYVIVPIKPEFMATIGLPLLANSLKAFQIENDDHEIEIAGLVFNHSSSYSTGPEGQQSIKEVREEALRHGWNVFENQVKYSASYAKAAREGAPLAHTSYARSDVIAGFRRLKDEIFGNLGVVKEEAA
jgi:chromosome partitioning protein